jgi:hypothetical protein
MVGYNIDRALEEGGSLVNVRDTPPILMMLLLFEAYERITRSVKGLDLDGGF